MAMHDSILDTIGRTPVVRLQRVAPAHVELYAKIESFNPGGSVKDDETIAVADAHGMAMLMTGERHFRH